MDLSGKRLLTLVIAAAIACGGFVGWMIQPAAAGGVPGISCNGTIPNDSRVGEPMGRVADISFNLGTPDGSNSNSRVTTKGWGDFTTYPDGTTVARDQKPGEHNKVMVSLYPNQLGKAVLIKVQIGRGRANDAGQVFLNGVRPLCANPAANDYGYQVPTGLPTYLTFEWMGGANIENPMVFDFFNQAAELANHDRIDTAGLAGVGFVQVWFLS